jgi:molecular chaperone DnaK (HSP70)
MSPSSPPALCPECHRPAGRFDRFCGTCGAHLARLRWQSPDNANAWQEGDGRLALAEGAVARIAFENSGVVPLALILDDRTLGEFPEWLDVSVLRGTIPLSPGEGPRAFDLPLVGAESLFRSDLDTPEARLLFLTSASDRPLEVVLALAPEPWIEPAASLYRFIPLERLQQGVVHEIKIHSAARASIDSDCTVDEDPLAAPQGYVRIPTAALLRSNFETPLPLEAGAILPYRLLLQASELSLPADSLGWFSAIIRWNLVFEDGSQEEVSTRLSGALGRGPTLELRGGASHYATTPHRDTQHRFTFYNPGQLPVQVRTLEVLRERDGREEPAPDPDWLVLKGLAPADLLSPGEERTLTVAFQPADRPEDEFLVEEVSSRTIVVTHDGWQESGANRTVCQVAAAFGRATVRTLGIDFGTSNSAACLMGKRQGYPITLESYGNGLRLDYMASLIYFDDRHSGAPDSESFLYGEAAKGSANNEPANLVRSIKTVVSDGAKSEYRFLKKGTDGFQDVKVRTQELLNLFIGQVRSRAEQGVLSLKSEIRRREKLLDRRASFRRAVFSHPVEITDSMKLALMQAAHKAGINKDIGTPQEFFDERCVDEATAAVLAFVNQLLIDKSEGRSGSELKDLERILCIDIGGGTTDIAAVAVKDMASYAAEVTDKVTVELWSKSGDRRFAGDTLDQMLGGEILKDIERQSREQGALVLIEKVMDAMLASSYSAYRLQFNEKMKIDPQQLGTGETPDPHTIYGSAAFVLQAAEEAKRAFSTEPTWVKTFTGTGWPRDTRDTAAAAAQNFKVELRREVFEAIVRGELEKRFHLLGSVITGAGWEWSSVTKLLLTGQSMRSPIIRQPILEYVRAQMGEEAAQSLAVVAPGEGPEVANNFDPKACVAIGAALWGMSRDEDDAWLAIVRPYLGRLTFDLKTYGGARYKRIPGLMSGAPLPAEGVVEFSTPRRNLILYRDKEEFVHFTNFKPTKRITVLVETLADYWVVIDGEKFRGEISS